MNQIKIRRHPIVPGDFYHELAYGKGIPVFDGVGLSTEVPVFSLMFFPEDAKALENPDKDFKIICKGKILEITVNNQTVFIIGLIVGTNRRVYQLYFDYYQDFVFLGRLSQAPKFTFFLYWGIQQLPIILQQENNFDWQRALTKLKSVRPWTPDVFNAALQCCPPPEVLWQMGTML